ncbi:DNA-binding response regulator, NarL/FixJ family, contains REC and HTH domains [Streptoalloteichus tenebrarius]|uniref:DNA-binding response regulator, NarL/FixJ family, contains REC and HTH domains n=1 Tax=Streptoalloteichus tenebrarius (strain ATCC 17920 / DSM 40477 / JCM 4838 / CBS 697.72 / NBRC 16177 / NCIMB 11028 / NRRL B-12390 / A12253. 1 / ISP 5477) TaxID=1933 RepID=A0ABT1HU31_STRSD|nr:LuxR C-terminal-related transcriptional regulator [Streptoalloteichus tenebrarius]MCP2259036.1 DNA-binding response regulator, NarL/FixJ family, contains REC and HTH domains [Streptoalloteichus tenebrarius]BFE99639.1 response regulator [Streptoalloteichus tenebrarius]
MSVTHEFANAAGTAGRERHRRITVAVVDGRAVVRRGIPAMLSVAPEIRTVRCFSGVSRVDEVAGFDVLVLGVHSRRDLGLLTLANDLAGRSRVLLLCSSVLMAATLALLDAGADGYLTTDAPEQAVRDAVRRVADGQPYLGGPVAELLRHSAPSTGAPRLAPREAELLRHLADGLTHAQAARRMGVAVGTVETYARRIRTKFAVVGPVQLARLARQAQLQRMLD